MQVKKIFCPNCGKETMVNTEKTFFFCPQCGNKIELSNAPQTEFNNPEPADTIPETEKEDIANNIINEKLEEAEFYYKTSYEKKEYDNTTAEPVYYLKAQDLLVDLSDEYPTDYRIWWELSKPVDYMSTLQKTGGSGQYRINTDYFNKALDNADIENKKRIIAEKDKYEANKAFVVEMEQQRLQEEAERLEAQRKQEQRKEEARQREEQQRRQKEAKRLEEQREQERREKEEREKALAEEKELTLKTSVPLWQALNSQDYFRLDNQYFVLQTGNNQTIVALFKTMANVLYLNTYRIDGNKGNAVYKEQSMAMQFNESGYGISFNKKPINIRELTPPNNILRVTLNTSDEIFVNDIQLKSDSEYIRNILKKAKKPLFSTTKIFD